MSLVNESVDSNTCGDNEMGLEVGEQDQICILGDSFCLRGGESEG